MQSSSQEKLVKLLVTLFKDELRSFLGHLTNASKDELDDFVSHLPAEGTSPRRLAEVAVELLARRGLLDEAFFRDIASERPRRRQEVAALAQKFGIDLAGAVGPFELAGSARARGPEATRVGGRRAVRFGVGAVLLLIGAASTWPLWSTSSFAIDGESDTSISEDPPVEPGPPPADAKRRQGRESTSSTKEEEDTPKPAKVPKATLVPFVTVPFKIVPEGAEVTIFRNDAPLQTITKSGPVLLPTGATYTYRATKAKYKAQTGAIPLTPMTITIDLVQLAALKLVSGARRPPAKVWVDNVALYRSTPVGFMAEPGPHTIKWVYPDGIVKEKKITAVEGVPLVVSGD